MSFSVETAFLKALAGIKGQVDGRAQRAGSPCDLSGSVKGRTTATDIIDQMETDAERTISSENRVEVLQSYIEAYNRVLGKTPPS